MYTLKISDENTVTTTVKEKIIERSNYVDKIQIIVDKSYREQIDISSLKAENEELKEKISEIDNLKKSLDELRVLITNK